MNDPSPPLAPVIRTILLFEGSLGSMTGCFLREVRAQPAQKVSNWGLRAGFFDGVTATGLAKRQGCLGIEQIGEAGAAAAIAHGNTLPAATHLGVTHGGRLFAVNANGERTWQRVVGLMQISDPGNQVHRSVSFCVLTRLPAPPLRQRV